MDGYRWIFDLQKLGVMDGYKCNQFSQTWFMFVLQTQVFNGIIYIYYYKDLFTHKDINTYINGVV